MKGMAIYFNISFVRSSSPVFFFLPRGVTECKRKRDLEKYSFPAPGDFQEENMSLLNGWWTFPFLRSL